jgi:hypothetical protein
LDTLSEEEQHEACAILLRNAAILARMGNLTDMIIATIDALSQKPYTNKRDILETVMRILRHEKLTEEKRQRCEQIQQRLTGDDFHSLLKRYITMTVFVDSVDVEGKNTSKVQQKILELAQQAIEQPDLLIQELNWLVTTEARNGDCFGYALGERDKEFSLLPTILEVQRKIMVNASVSFLGGYLRVLAKQNQHRWEDLMNALTADEKLRIWISELTCLSGNMNDQSALRVLNIAKEGIAGIEQLQKFVYNDALHNISDEVFRTWIEFLRSHPNISAIHIALDLYYAYYVREKTCYEFPEELTFQLLTSPLLSQKPDRIKQDYLSSWQWEKIGKAFVQTYPPKSLELADIILQNFGETGTVFDGPYSWSLLTEIMRNYPEQVWSRVTKYLKTSERQGSRLTQWLQHDYFEEGQEGALSLISPELVWQWIDEDVEQRAWYFAYRCVPKVFFRDEKRVCWARELIVRYWDREDVCRNLAANVSMRASEGDLSLHYQQQKQELREFIEQEDNEHVKQWFDNYIFELEKDIKHAQIQEEREDF